MKIGSTHNHSTGSDGKLTPEQVIEKAISLGWEYVYFTDHYPNPKNALKEKSIKYNDKNFFTEDYVKEIKELKEKYKDEIEVCFGVELGWLKGYEKWAEEQLKQYDFDYIIGSIHDILDKDGMPHATEDGKEKWIKDAEVFGGAEGFVKEYYRMIKALVNSGLFDCVGHLDYIKVYNEPGDLFSEEDAWYKKEVLDTLDLIKKQKIAIEINAGGLRKCNAPFPSLWILKEAKKRDIPITLGIDVHWEEHYNNEIMEQLVEIAKEAGYKKVARFVKRKMVFVDI